MIVIDNDLLRTLLPKESPKNVALVNLYWRLPQLKMVGPHADRS
jgi:hypothetical protein